MESSYKLFNNQYIDIIAVRQAADGHIETISIKWRN
jgi:hypothetical protein